MTRYTKSMREAMEEVWANDITLDEGKMKTIATMFALGKSAEEIANKMKLPVATVKTILGEEDIAEAMLWEFTDSQITKLKKDYDSLKGAKISLARANQLRNIFDKITDSQLPKLYKADIPFLSTLALSRMIKKGIQVPKGVRLSAFREDKGEETWEQIMGESLQQGFAVRYNLQGRGRLVQAYKTQKDAEHRAKILRAMGGVKDVSITKHKLNFKEYADYIEYMAKNSGEAKVISNMFKGKVGTGEINVSGSEVRVDSAKDVESVHRAVMTKYPEINVMTKEEVEYDDLHFAIAGVESTGERSELQEAIKPFMISYSQYGKHIGFEDGDTLRDIQNKAQKLRAKGFTIDKMGRYNPPLDKKLRTGKTGVVQEQDEMNSESETKEKEIEHLKAELETIKQKHERQISILKQKNEIEKNKAVKPQPNPETGEVPLAIGLAQKILKDKDEEAKKEKQQKENSKKIKDLAKPGKPKSFKEYFYGTRDIRESAAEKAKGMGLTYMSFGRYGKDGKVTHKSIGGTLTAVDKDENPIKDTSTKKDEPKTAKSAKKDGPKKDKSAKKDEPKKDTPEKSSEEKALEKKIKSKNFLRDLENDELKLADGDTVQLDFDTEDYWDDIIKTAKDGGLDELADDLDSVQMYVQDYEPEKAQAEFQDIKSKHSGEPVETLEWGAKADKAMEMFDDNEYDGADTTSLNQFTDDMLNTFSLIQKQVDTDETSGNPGSGSSNSSRGFRDETIFTLQQLKDSAYETIDTVKDEVKDEKVKEKLEDILGEIDFVSDDMADHDGYTKPDKVNGTIEDISRALKEIKKLLRKGTKNESVVGAPTPDTGTDEIDKGVAPKKKEDVKVKFAMKKDQKIATASYKDKKSARDFVKSILAKGGKAIMTEGTWLVTGEVSYADDFNPMDEFEVYVNATSKQTAQKKVDDMLEKLYKQKKIGSREGRKISEIEFHDTEQEDGKRGELSLIRHTGSGKQRKKIRVNEETYGWTLVSKAKDIAKKMAGNLTGATKEIEKLARGLSSNPSVEQALRTANESIQKEAMPGGANSSSRKGSVWRKAKKYRFGMKVGEHQPKGKDIEEKRIRPKNAIGETDLTKSQTKKVHKKADDLPKKSFRDRYGKKKGDSIRYGVATNQTKKKLGIENKNHPAKKKWETLTAKQKKKEDDNSKDILPNYQEPTQKTDPMNIQTKEPEKKKTDNGTKSDKIDVNPRIDYHA